MTLVARTLPFPLSERCGRIEAMQGNKQGKELPDMFPGKEENLDGTFLKEGLSKKEVKKRKAETTWEHQEE